MLKNKDISLTEKSRQASKASGEKLLKQHKKTGEPIISWKDEKVVYLSPYDMKEVDPVKAYAACENKAEYGKEK